MSSKYRWIESWNEQKNIYKKNIDSNYKLNSTKIFLQDYNQSIKFEIWDTSGQEKYRSLAKVFHKIADVCLLVYDITRRVSFKELKNFGLMI